MIGNVDQLLALLYVSGVVLVLWLCKATAQGQHHLQRKHQ